MQWQLATRYARVSTKVIEPCRISDSTAASATIDVDKLKAAFKNVYDAMDSVSNYKVAALNSMQQTVTALEGEVKTATAYLERTKAG